MYRLVFAFFNTIITRLLPIEPVPPQNMGAGTAAQAVPQCEHDCRFDHCSLMAESWFTHRLRLERMRTERSRQPFLLLLLEIDGPAAFDGGNGQFTRAVFGALASCTRETDIIGWYSHNSVLGELFTAIGTPADVDKSVTSIVSKVTSALDQQLDRKSVVQRKREDL